MKSILMKSWWVWVLSVSLGWALFDTHVEREEPDYETKWDTMADSGNMVPHRTNDDALLKYRTVVLSRDVNANSVHHLITSLLMLDRAEPGKPIDLLIRTNGGWSDDVYAIIDVMETLESPVNTWAMGSTYSAGAMILAAGTGTRRAMPNSLIMVHDNSPFGEGEFDFDRLDREREMAMWKRCAKLPEDWFQEEGDFTYYLNAEQALKYGMVDEIMERREGSR